MHVFLIVDARNSSEIPKSILNAHFGHRYGSAWKQLLSSRLHPDRLSAVAQTMHAFGFVYVHLRLRKIGLGLVDDRV
jgi:hypothetical protein